MRRIFFVAVGVIGAGIACGGSVTSVDGSKNVASLSSSDSNQLCTDTYNYFVNNFSTNDILKFTCGLEAGEVVEQPDAGASASSTCSSTFQTCMSQGTTQTIPSTPDCSSFATSVASCNTTVSQYTKCFQEEISAAKNLEGQMPLCSAGTLEQAELQADAQLDAACLQLIENGCSFVVGFGSSSSSSGGNVDGG